MMGSLPLKTHSTSSKSVYEFTVKSASAQESSVTKDPQNTANNEQKTSSNPKQEKDDFFIDEYNDPASEPKKESFLDSIIGVILTIFKYVISLAFVLALGYISIQGLKLFTSNNNSLLKNEDELIKIIELKYLAPNKALYLVTAGEKILLLGVGGNNINLLSEITEPEEVAKIKSHVKKKDVDQTFHGHLSKFTKRFNIPRKTSSEKIKGNVRETARSIQKKLIDFKSLGGEKDD